MKQKIFPNAAFIVALILIFSSPIFSQNLDTKKIDEALGRTGSSFDTVYKVTFPRSDLKVQIGGFTLEPAMGLTAWIGFMPMGDDAMIMGDLVLLENEVYPVMKKMFSEGISVSALHNHFLGSNPHVMFMHFSGMGDAAKLAASMKKVIGMTKTPMGKTSPPVAVKIDWSKVESIFGVKGSRNGHVLNIGVKRTDQIKEGDTIIPPSMGTAMPFYFQMRGKKCAITGDFELTADEVNPVVETLVKNGIAATAVHNHMLGENPRLFYVHFWAVGDPGKLATALKEALGKTNAAGK